MKASADQLSDPSHPGGLLFWAYWMTLVLCILSLPLAGFYLLMLLAYEGSTPLPLSSVNPLLLAMLAWVTLDVLARAYRLRAQHHVAYLICVLLAQGVAVFCLALAAFSGTPGSGLGFVCFVMAATAMGASVHITLQVFERRG